MKIINSFGKELYGLNITQTTLLPFSFEQHNTMLSWSPSEHQKSCNFQYPILKHTFIVKYIGNLKYRPKAKKIVTSIIIEFCAFVCNSVMLLKAYLTKYICCLWTTDSTTRFPAPQSQNKLPSWTWIIHTQLSHFAKLLENLHESLLPPV
jgi:hypothetical protein